MYILLKYHTFIYSTGGWYYTCALDAVTVVDMYKSVLLRYVGYLYVIFQSIIVAPGKVQ
jgi:hypothetical protein